MQKKSKNIIDRELSIEGQQESVPLEVKGSTGDELPLRQVSEAELRRKRGKRFNSRNKLR